MSASAAIRTPGKCFTATRFGAGWMRSSGFRKPRGRPSVREDGTRRASRSWPANENQNLHQVSDAETGDAGFLSEAVGVVGQVGELVLGLSATDTCTDDGVMARFTIHQLDPNHKAIRAGLEAVGCTCDSRGPLDLVVGFRGVNYLLEIKKVKGSRSELNAKQAKFFREWKGQKALVRTMDEALQVVGAIGALR